VLGGCDQSGVTITANRFGPDFGSHLEYYRQQLLEKGPTAPGVGWRTAESQELRFDKLLTVLGEDTDGAVSVNDLGCGYGALFQSLHRRGVPVERYYGYDITKEMLGSLREQVQDERVEGILGDRVTEKAEYSFASGVFYLRFDVADDDWSAYVRSLVRNLAECSTRAFAFNMLSTYSDYQEDHLYYGDPVEWFRWCRREITPLVSLWHDYPLFEWTITGRVT
jgi:SAM-dependent methyltransferase